MRYDITVVRHLILRYRTHANGIKLIKPQPMGAWGVVVEACRKDWARGA